MAHHEWRETAGLLRVCSLLVYARIGVDLLVSDALPRVADTNAGDAELRQQGLRSATNAGW